ncbi:HDOD domain-containing protein [Methyloterricola oryzae]|uniref:HDOD domain-containing protein n=1 Tax=Methyloterricola oryzae TaxID=1495050 RepID=UPI0005EBD4F4|nr:HDOD domain-containing protein [Methyloterricola oryzae]
MKTLEEMFAHTQNLPTVPEVVLELIKSFDDPQADGKQIAKKIAMDQVLVARVLRMANSARFGLPRQVASIDDSMMVLGFNAVRTLVVASGLASAFKGPPGFDLKGFWRLSAATAEYAQLLAKPAGQRTDLAYSGGLMLHIGMLLILLEMPEQAQVVARAVDTGGSRAGVEAGLLGFNHANVSAELAKRWNFPDQLVQAFNAYPSPLAAEPFIPLAGVFHLADYLATRQDQGADLEALRAGLPEAVVSKLGLDADALMASLPPYEEASRGLDELMH